MNGRLLKESVIAHLRAKATEERPYKQPEISTDDALAELTFNERADPPLTPVIIRNHPATSPQIEFFPEGTDESSVVNVDNWTFTGTEWKGMLSPTMYEVRLPTGRSKRLPVLAGVPAELRL